MVTSVPEFVQWGAIKALGAEADVRRNVREVQKRVEVACKGLDKIDSLEYFKPEGAMYLFPRIKKRELSGESFSDKLLGSGVSVAPGNAFGSYPEFFRISLGQRRSLIAEGIKRMGELLA